MHSLARAQKCLRYSREALRGMMRTLLRSAFDIQGQR